MWLRKRDDENSFGDWVVRKIDGGKYISDHMVST
jgi:hypothetical protein